MLGTYREASITGGRIESIECRLSPYEAENMKIIHSPAKWNIVNYESHAIEDLRKKCEVLESETKGLIMDLSARCKTLESEIEGLREYLRPLLDEMTVKNVNKILYGEGE